jgi:hypothetical protein
MSVFLFTASNIYKREYGHIRTRLLKCRAKGSGKA